MKKNIIYFVVFLTTYMANAQVAPPTPGGGGSGVATGGPGPPGLPINDYLYILVILGVFYGIKKIKSLSTD